MTALTKSPALVAVPPLVFTMAKYQPTRCYVFTASKKIGRLRRALGCKLGLLEAREEWLDKESHYMIFCPRFKKRLGLWGWFVELMGKADINPLYFANRLRLDELPNIMRDFLMPLPKQAEEIAGSNGCKLEYVHFRRSGYNTFVMYEGDERLGYTLFIDSNEID